MNSSTLPSTFVSESYGVGSRLSKSPSPELEDFFNRVYLDGFDEKAFSLSIWVNFAHVVMLSEEKIIPQEAASSIIKVLLELEASGKDAIQFSPHIGDSLPNMENYVIGKLGDSVGGMLHTGRSRGDYYATLSRLKLRTEVLTLMGSINSLRQTLLEIANSHIGTVMPGYTHLQHAQPITLAHYLLATIQGLERDLERAREAYPRLNRSPLGLGIVSGTSYAVNRERTAELMAFDGLVRNSRDLGDRDYILEIANISATTMIHGHKLATDLYEWSTAEFRIAQVDDSDAMTSSMMPQKANPVLLEDFRARTGFVIGYLTSCYAVLKGSPANNIEISSGDKPGLAAVREASDALIRFSKSLPRIVFDESRMHDLAAAHWSQATEVADALVRDTSLSFREAHRVVGKLVSTAIARRSSPAECTINDLEEAAAAVLPNPPDMSMISLSDALDVRLGVERRQGIGGPSSNSVAVELESAQASWEADAAWLKAETDGIAKSHATMVELAKLF